MLECPTQPRAGPTTIRQKGQKLQCHRKKANNNKKKNCRNILWIQDSIFDPYPSFYLALQSRLKSDIVIEIEYHKYQMPLLQKQLTFFFI